jgi:hypothetical protein
MRTSFVEDTVSFQLQAATIVVNDTVRITVTVSASANSKTSETTLRSDIKEALNHLIPNADWAFGAMIRNIDKSGLELVQINATTRVNEKENYKLADRARSASREGLSLAEPVVDNSVPGPKIEAAESELRRNIIEKVKAEIEVLYELTGVKYRIGAISFSGIAQMPKTGNIAPFQMAAYYTGTSGAASSSEEPEEGLSNSQRVSLSADIELRSITIV